MTDTLTFYKSKGSSEWRWRYQAQGNFERLANGGESYHSLESCMDSAYRVCGMARSLPATAMLAAGSTEYSRKGGESVLVVVE